MPSLIFSNELQRYRERRSTRSYRSKPVWSLHCLKAAELIKTWLRSKSSAVYIWSMLNNNYCLITFVCFSLEYSVWVYLLFPYFKAFVFLIRKTGVSSSWVRGSLHDPSAGPRPRLHQTPRVWAAQRYQRVSVIYCITMTSLWYRASL